MTPEEFKALRKQLGLTQTDLAPLLDYNDAIRISEIENGHLPIQTRVAMLMEAFAVGWRPKDRPWPTKEEA